MKIVVPFEGVLRIYMYGFSWVRSSGGSVGAISCVSSNRLACDYMRVCWYLKSILFCIRREWRIIRECNRVHRYVVSPTSIREHRRNGLIERDDSCWKRLLKCLQVILNIFEFFFKLSSYFFPECNMKFNWYKESDKNILSSTLQILFLSSFSFSFN